MKKNKILSVVKCTVEKNIRNKWFILLNVILLLISLVTINFNTVKQVFKNHNIDFDKNKLQIEFVDNNNLIYDSVCNDLTKKDFKDKIEITKKDRVEYDENTLDKKRVIVEVIPSFENMLDLKIISKEGIDSKYIDFILEKANEKKNLMFSEKYSLTEDNLNNITKKVNVERIMVGVDSKNSQTKLMVQTFANYIILLILMIVLSKIANDISQEKATKSIEYVFTTINEKSYLIAKVMSVIFTILIQALFAICFFLISSSLNSLLNIYLLKSEINPTLANVDLSNISILSGIGNHLILYGAIIFVFAILSIFILCIIQAVISARTTNASESSDSTVILMIVNLIFYALSTFMVSPLKETNIFVYIISCLPIASMYFIPSMMLIGKAKIIQIIIAFILLVVSVPFVFKYGSKWFKEGVLNSTKKKKNKKDNEKTLKEIQEEYVKRKDFSKYGFVIGISVIIFISLQIVLTLIVSPCLMLIGKNLNLSTSITNNIATMIIFALSLLIPTLFVMMYIEKDKENVKKESINKDGNRDENIENDNSILNNKLLNRTIDNETNENNTEKQNKFKLKFRLKLKLNFDKFKNIDYKLWIKSIFISIPIVFIVQIALSFLLEKLGLNYDIVDKANLYDSTSTMSKILFFIQIAILPAIFEELYIRKAVLNYSKKYGKVFAIISSALLFSLVHLNISQSLFAFIMGIILGIVAIKTKSIIPTAIIHFLNNGFAALVTIFSDNTVALTVLNVVMILFIAIGVIISILQIIKYKEAIIKFIKQIKNKEIKLNNIVKKNNNKGYKYILYDFSFIIACILILVMLVLTQKFLNIL